MDFCDFRYKSGLAGKGPMGAVPLMDDASKNGVQK